MKLFRNILFGIVCSVGFIACDDNLNTDNYYTFTGEMMSDYITSRPQYSDFATVVERAGLMDLLSTYGHYTCFLPDNEAFKTYLKEKNELSIDSLTDAECDTIARTHLVSNMYSTVEMIDGTLHTANMNRRYIQITHGLDEDSNAVVILNRAAHIYFGLEDDSVENGIVHPINMVLENSNASIIEIIKKNDKVKLFYDALKLTGVDETLQQLKDPDYNSLDYERYYYKSDMHNEVATVPDEKKFGFTLFITPDSILKEKHGIESIPQLAEKAKELYSQTYKDDNEVLAQLLDAYDKEEYENPKHPLNMFVRYCILNRDVKGWDYITIKEFHEGDIQGALGIRVEKVNPVDWYQTLLEGTMIKFEQLTVQAYKGNGIMNQRYANRRHEGAESEYQFEGALISPTVEDEYIQDAPNGRYFYVDDIVAFTPDVRDKVQNMRIRMDFSTIFPELMTHDIRLNGDPMKNDNDAVADDAFKNGRNYYFPAGYLDGVTFRGNCKFLYRRPHISYYVFCGDEMNLFGDYDFQFRLPPVPYSGEWQVRLGYSVTSTRGIAQVYFDSIPQGIPLDMRRSLSHESIMGTDFTEVSYDEMTKEEKAEDQKALKNKGYYRGPAGAYYATSKAKFETLAETPRRILCQVYIDNKRDHYLRIRCASKSKTGNNNEFMLDYIELVPKSVYGVGDEGAIEDDL